MLEPVRHRPFEPGQDLFHRRNVALMGRVHQCTPCDAGGFVVYAGDRGPFGAVPGRRLAVAPEGLLSAAEHITDLPPGLLVRKTLVGRQFQVCCGQMPSHVSTPESVVSGSSHSVL